MLFATPKPLVMMLAGLPATGKSTELRNALLTGRALFGAEAEAAFRRLRAPPADAENDLTLEQRLDNAHWVHEIDLFRLDRRRTSCPSLVVHFDLFWYLWGGRDWRDDLGLLATDEQLAAFLDDERGMARAFSRVFTLHPLRGARVIVQVLKPDYDVASSRGRQRDQDTPAARFQQRHLYDGSATGRGRYDRIYAAWHLATTRPWDVESGPSDIRSTLPD